MAAAEKNEAFDAAIELAAPFFRLSGVDLDHELAGMVGQYERLDEREKIDCKFDLHKFGSV